MISFEIIAAVFLTSCMFLALIQMVALRHDVAGDTYIHLTFARNLATGYGFSYNRGEPSNGSSSPLWTLILAFLFKMVGPPRILDAGRIAAGICHLLSVLAIYVAVRQVLPQGPAALVAACLWALNPNAADWAMRAMDTSLFILLILCGSIVLAAFLAAPNLGLAVILGIVSGLAILCRPEGWFWFGIAIACLAVSISVTKSVVVAPVLPGIVLFSSFAVLLPYYLWMLRRFGTVMPSSRARVLHYRQYARRLGPFFFSDTAGQLVIRGLYRSLFPFACIGGAMLFFEGSAFSKTAIVELFLFSIAVMAFYSFVITGIDYGYRYILPALPGLIVLSVISMDLLYQHVPLYVSLLGAVFVFVPVLRRALSEFRRTWNFMKAYVVGQEEPVRTRMAKWVRDSLPEGVTIAAKEIDQLAFYSKPGQRILSMDGTIGGEALPYLQNSDLLQFLCHYRPTHLLIEGNIYRFYPFWASLRLAALASEQCCGMNDNCEIDGLKFTLLHEETFYPYADMWGRLSDNRCAWRLFSIGYPFDDEARPTPEADKGRNTSISIEE